MVFKNLNIICNSPMNNMQWRSYTTKNILLTIIQKLISNLLSRNYRYFLLKNKRLWKRLLILNCKKLSFPLLKNDDY